MEIKIASMDITNFKGVRKQSVSFSQTTNIFGPNHSGKTTIADAYCWVLFHKDSHGNARFGIKTLDEKGNEIHKLNHQVSLTLIVDDSTMIFRKNYHEDWIKPRGKVEEELKGHSIEYFINDVPCSLRDYDNKVREIVSEDKFRLLSDVLAFSNLNWKEQKQILRELAGDIDLNVNGVLNDARFAKLIQWLNNGQSLDDYEKAIRSKAKIIKERLERIPSEIEGKQETIQEINLSEIEEQEKNLELQKASLKDQLNEVNEHIESITTRANAFTDKRQKLIKDISAIDDEINSLRISLNSENFNDFEAKVHDYRQYKQTLIANQTKRANLTNQIKTEETYIESLKKDKAKAGDDWNTVTNTKWSGSEICPTCGQPLPEDQIDAAKEKFNNDKAEKIKAIEAAGFKLKKEINDRNSAVDKMKAELNSIQDPQPMEEPQLVAVDITTSVEYKKAMQKREALQKELDSMVFTDSSTEYKQQRLTITIEIDSINNSLRELAAKKGAQQVNENTLKQIKELENEQQQQNIALAELEREIETAFLYRQNEVNVIESKVNSNFRLARFRFFEPLVNGGFAETCECTMHGTPYANLSTSEKVNVGIDIINALQRYLSCTAPIIIDNAEGVTDFEPTNAQTIRLFVKDVPSIQIANDLF